MPFSCTIKKTATACLIGLMIAWAWQAPISLAADDRETMQINSATTVSIRELKPVRLRTPDPNLRPQQVYDIVGNLNAIDGNQITIGGRQLTLDSGVSASGIAMWTEVGVNLNEAGNVSAIEIVSNEPH